MNKWKRIEEEIHGRSESCVIHTLNGKGSTEQVIGDALKNGETDFVAAGGDGSVNSLLNILLSIAQPNQLQNIRLGAIGLGSSNDFHKPFRQAQLIGGIPCKVDFTEARPRDVACVSYMVEGTPVTKYFLVNASCGVTAEGNRFFNSPDRVLGFLKRLHTPTAILYGAVRTILRYENFRVKVQSKETGKFTTNLTNLAVLKSPHFSGSLYYDTPVAPDSGSFVVNVCESMRKRELIRLLSSLGQGKFKGLNNTRSWSTSSLSISSEKPFAVELDGEIVQTQSVQFSILAKHIRVCP